MYLLNSHPLSSVTIQCNLNNGRTLRLMTSLFLQHWLFWENDFILNQKPLYTVRNKFSYWKVLRKARLFQIVVACCILLELSASLQSLLSSTRVWSTPLLRFIFRWYNFHKDGVEPCRVLHSHANVQKVALCLRAAAKWCDIHHLSVLSRSSMVAHVLALRRERGGTLFLAWSDDEFAIPIQIKS